MTSIAGYGVYIPRYRIKIHEIARVWGADGDRVSKGLMINEKSVPGFDEDSTTIAVEAARNAVEHSGVNPKDIGAIYFGSESPAYSVKPTASIIAEAIEASPNMTAADIEFACKAGTAGIQMCMGLTKSEMIKYGMAIGADTSQGRPGDALEYSAAAGGAAFIIGQRGIADIEGTFSYTTDTTDFWRREAEEFPSHGARFTGQPAYFKHVTSATIGLMERLDLEIRDIDYFVPHQPNGSFPLKVGKTLGFETEKIMPSLKVPYIGNTYSGSSMVGLAGVLDVAKPNERILMTSYGSGAGSDSFSILVTDLIEEKRNKKTVDSYIKDKKYIDYAIYAKFKRKIKGVSMG